MHPGGGVFATSSYVAPTVSPNANNRSISDDTATTYSCLQYSNDGYERVNNNANAVEYVNTAVRGLWLDTGNASDVWLERTINSGSLYIDAGAGRLNLGTSRNFVVRDANPAGTAVSCNLTMDFWDAASGGTKIGTATFSLIANYFNPCPTCCFTPDTPIRMASGVDMPIGKIRVGDMILVMNPETRRVVPEEVTGVITRVNRVMYRVYFDNGVALDTSEDHPFDVKGKGPASINPLVEYKDAGMPDTLKVGDRVTDVAGRVHRITKIEPIEYPGTVYTLENTLFFARGMLVY